MSPIKKAYNIVSKTNVAPRSLGWAKKYESEAIQEHTWGIMPIGPLSYHAKFQPIISYQKGAPNDFVKLATTTYGQNFENLFLAEIKILLY